MLACSNKNIKPHFELLKQYIQWQIIMLSPICPHLCEHLWRNSLKEKGSVMHAQFPTFEPADQSILAAHTFIESLLRSGRLNRSNYVAQLNKKAKKGTNQVAESDFDQAKVFVANNWPAWQIEVVQELKDIYDPVAKCFPLMGENNANAKALVSHFNSKPQFSATIKKNGK